jgi:hypoxanthine-guanine phosphoribosyltransferase
MIPYGFWEPYTVYFIEASSYKNSQTQLESIEILSIINPAKFENKTVILIDELYDNGTPHVCGINPPARSSASLPSGFTTIQFVKEKIVQSTSIKNTDIYTCVLFKKNKQNTTFISDVDIYGCTVPNVWLVGYGLDDKQEKRGWVNVYAVPKNSDIEKTDDDIIIFGH